MKTLNLILIMVLSLSTIGCSSLGGLIPMTPVSHGGNGFDSLSPLHPQLAQNESKSFEVFNTNPYALHLELEDTASDEIRTPANGDGGASLNAYAACLTLKVMF